MRRYTEYGRDVKGGLRGALAARWVNSAVTLGGPGIACAASHLRHGAAEMVCLPGGAHASGQRRDPHYEAQAKRGRACCFYRPPRLPARVGLAVWSCALCSAGGHANVLARGRSARQWRLGAVAANS
eukprot:365010-Chlamydomonas_euryale.AAC.6